MLDGCGQDDPAVVFAWNEASVSTAAADLADNAGPFWLTLAQGANAATYSVG